MSRRHTRRRPRKIKAAAGGKAPAKIAMGTRGVYFAMGAAIGGTIGYGLLSGGPAPAPSLLEPVSLIWIFGFGTLCGILAAASPRRFWLQGRFRWRHGPDD